jgi:hypothetical protein
LPIETLGEYMARLRIAGRWREGPDATASLGAAVALLERTAYSSFEPDGRTRAFVEDVIRGLRPARAGRRTTRGDLTTA